jgi:Ca-activated chloride channel family protein
MAFCEDIKPNRLDAAKAEIEKAYTSLHGVYQSSLIPFSGASHIAYCPLTTKKNTFLSLLRDLDYKTVDVPGTDINSAFSVLSHVAEERGINSGKNIVFMLSDGGKEDAAGVNMDELNSVIKSMLPKGFIFNTIGIGGISPSPLVKRTDGKFAGYYTDANRVIMKSAMDESILKTIARNGRGQYHGFRQTGDLERQIKEIADSYLEYDYDKPYQEIIPIQHWFYGTACLLLVGLLLSQNKR